ncbi:hypothetical protein E4U22_001210 [Claviceps purpurea]|nr:hypothetical protein E4U38_000466 [Claviceps purpurea]KAG6142103.1 hypothetical protein E4U12_003771 [Claviceps purpurea]KAG6148896.1 hypothetical protein E4U28_003033 [Claviceps purpurea]KAG6150813.1 hypothetical protein E4U37_005652 [Claviceps purpurea]KAG6162146.1 hypothetical protein E4U51_006585 [Claviceps purpurea]
MATLNRKYAALPDLDSAPDIYETPELTDDNSTVPTTTNRAQSDDEFYDVDGDDADENGISRTRLRINEARSRFLSGNADTNTSRFSDRVDGKRKSYRASSRRQRILHDGTYELGDLSGDDDDGGDDESLERKVARLKREVEEAKAEYMKRSTTNSGDSQSEAISTEGLRSLSHVLDEIAKPLGLDSSQAPTNAAVPNFTSVNQAEGVPAEDGATYTIKYAPSYEQSHALAKAADFDRRLLMLEKTLGIGSSSETETGSNGLLRAILPTLDGLEKQVSTLSQASTSNLDAISRRVRTLAAEQDKLNETREKAKALREELGKQNPAPVDESEQESKIKALYGILPTIENLTPMLPPLLDRLRSLRAIHADAATASQTLERIESQQIEMTGELKLWKEGLEKVEHSMKDGETLMKENVKVMEGWIQDLEARAAKFA